VFVSVVEVIYAEAVVIVVVVVVGVVVVVLINILKAMHVSLFRSEHRIADPR